MAWSRFLKLDPIIPWQTPHCGIISGAKPKFDSLWKDEAAVAGM
jgi:hypothetical protein